MHETTELREAIGRDATLPYAGPAAWVAAVSLDAASAALITAIIRCRGIGLLAMLGAQPMQNSQAMQMPRRQDEGLDQDEGDEHAPDHPDAPDRI